MPSSARIPFEGVLNCWNDEHDLPDLLLSISRSGKTGRLQFSNPEGDKTVFIKEGKIIFAESSSDDDGLGQYLLRVGKVSLVDFMRVTKLVRPGKRLGAVFVEHGILGPKDLVPAVKGQVRTIILGLFRRTETWYGFKEEPSRKEAITLDLPVDQLVLEGVRYVESWRRISKGAGSLDSVYETNPDLRPQWESLRMPDPVREILTALNTKHSVAEICTKATLADIDACRYLWAFRCLEWIRSVPSAVTTKPSMTSAVSAPEVSPSPIAASTAPPSVPEIEIEPDLELESQPKPPPTLVSAKAKGKRQAKENPLADSVPEIEIEPAPDSKPVVATANVVGPLTPDQLAHTQVYSGAQAQPGSQPADSATSKGSESENAVTTGEMMEAILEDREPEPPKPAEPTAPEPASTQFFTGSTALPEPAPAANDKTQFFGAHSAVDHTIPPPDDDSDFDFLSMADSGVGFDTLLPEPPAGAPPTPTPPQAPSPAQPTATATPAQAQPASPATAAASNAEPPKKSEEPPLSFSDLELSSGFSESPEVPPATPPPPPSPSPSPSPSVHPSVGEGEPASVPIVLAQVPVEEPSPAAPAAVSPGPVPPPTRPAVKRPQPEIEDSTGGLEAFLSDDSDPFANDFSQSQSSGSSSESTAAKRDEATATTPSSETPVKKA